MSSEMTDIDELKELSVRGCKRCYVCETPDADCLNPYKECSVCATIRQLASDALALITSQKAIGEKEAEQRGVAWSIACIDQMHLVEEQTDTATDKIYKGIKNCLRDSYKAVAGVDPAPSYPIKVTIHQLSTEDVKDD